MQIHAMRSSQLMGACVLPASKSQSIRALLFASMALGDTRIKNILPSPDIEAMISACKQLGAQIQWDDDDVIVSGVDGQPIAPMEPIDSGNSGQVLRFVACLLGLQDQPGVITGDHSICTNRPVTPLISALPRLGVVCESVNGDGYAPLKVQGPYTENDTELSGKDSQPVSGLIMAAVFIDQVTTITVNNPGELPWIDLTLGWLDRFQIPYERHQGQYYRITGGQGVSGFDYRVPGDLSSLSFPLVAAVVSQSSIVIHDVDRSEPQGDQALIDVLENMGARMKYNANDLTLTVLPTERLQGIDVDINDFIDSIAILAVVGCFADGSTRITGAAIAREKESDRIHAIATELRKMGADIEELSDGLVIQQSALQGATVESHHDHRIAMSLAIAGMLASGETVINNTTCVAKSFPDFVFSMRSLGANISASEVGS